MWKLQFTLSSNLNPSGSTFWNGVYLIAFCGLIISAPVSAASSPKAKVTYVAPTRFDRSYAALPSLGNNTVSSRQDLTANVKAVPLSAKQLTSLRLKAEKLMKSGKLEEANHTLKLCFSSRPNDKLVQSDLLRVDLAQAKKLQAQKNLNRAANSCREALYFAPNNPAAIFTLNSILEQTGIDPKDFKARLSLAQQFFTQGKLADALVEYNQSLQLNPSVTAYLGLGDLYWRAGKVAYATQSYSQVLKIDPRNHDAYRQLGLIKLAAKDTVGASSDLSKSLTIDGSDPVAGKALINIWQQQVASTPDSANAHLGLARAYQLTGDLDPALAEYKTVVKIDPDHPNLSIARQSYKLAVARQKTYRCLQEVRQLVSQGNFNQASQKIAEAIAIDPHNPDLLLFQGELLEQMGQASQAADSYRAILYADPNNLEAANRLKTLSQGRTLFSSFLTPTAAPLTLPATPPTSPESTAPVIDLSSYTSGDVSKLANFLVALRNESLTQKKRVKKVEKSVRKVFDIDQDQNLSLKTNQHVDANQNTDLCDAGSYYF